jgi:hypothetical protein
MLLMVMLGVAYAHFAYAECWLCRVSLMLIMDIISDAYAECFFADYRLRLVLLVLSVACAE